MNKPAIAYAGFTEPPSSSPCAGARRAGALWTVIYLTELEQHARKSKAATAAGVTMRAVQKRRLADPEFAHGESDAMGVAKDLIEDEITRRAIEGIEEPVYQGGKLVGHIRRYSDTLLLRLAERSETGSWRTKIQVEQAGSQISQTRAERKAKLEKARAQIAANRAQDANRPIVLTTEDRQQSESGDLQASSLSQGLRINPWRRSKDLPISA